MEYKKACCNAAGQKCNSDSVEIIDALIADILAFVLDQTLHGGTEYAAVLILTKDDLITLNVNLHFVMLCDVQCSTQFNGKNDSAQFIHFADDSRRFHNQPNLSILCVFD